MRDKSWDEIEKEEQENLKRKTKTKILRGYSVYDFSGPVERMIDELKSYPEGAYLEGDMEWDCSNEVGKIKVLIDVEESDEEYNKRILKHKKILEKEKRTKLAWEKREFERLKKKFGE